MTSAAATDPTRRQVFGTTTRQSGRPAGVLILTSSTDELISGLWSCL